MKILEKTVTVIVPVYNAEKTIERCVRSIANQTYRDLQIILVNDGSKDGSLEVCRKMSEKDSRIAVIDQENSGVSAARNAGLARAQGEFFCFVDADDWIDPAFVEHLVYAMADADCVVTGYVQEGPGEKSIASIKAYRFSSGSLEGETIADFFVRGFVHPCWNKLYKTSVIQENRIAFQTGLHISEDSLFCIDYLKRCKTFITTAQTEYHYWKDPEQGSLSKKIYPDTFDTYETLFHAIREFLTAGNCDQPMVDSIVIRTVYPQLYATISKVYLSKNGNYGERIKRLRIELKREYCQYVFSNAGKYVSSTGEKVIVGLVNARCYNILGAVIRWVSGRK